MNWARDAEKPKRADLAQAQVDYQVAMGDRLPQPSYDITRPERFRTVGFA